MAQIKARIYLVCATFARQGPQTDAADLGLLGEVVIAVTEALSDHDPVPRKLVYPCVIYLFFGFPVRLVVLHGSRKSL